MVKYMIKYFIALICIFISQVTFAEDLFCYRNATSTLECFKSMDEIPELYKSSAFYRPSSVAVANPPKVTLEENNLSSNNSLPPAKSLDEKELNSQPLSPDSEVEPKLEIFVAKWCAHCKALEKFLKERGVKYKRYDVETDDFGAKVYEQEGTIPISILNGKTILGFDQRKYGEILDAELPY